MKNSFVDMFISIIAVLIFMGFTAYDNHMLKKVSKNESHQETLNKLALLGALALYLDYINLFINLLSLFGKRR
jgi:FtsH-binding integral membrane protein